MRKYAEGRSGKPRQAGEQERGNINQSERWKEIGDGWQNECHDLALSELRRG